MTFVVTSARERPQVRYEKVGRLIPGEKGMVAVIRDGYGVVAPRFTTGITNINIIAFNNPKFQAFSC